MIRLLITMATDTVPLILAVVYWRKLNKPMRLLGWLLLLNLVTELAFFISGSIFHLHNSILMHFYELTAYPLTVSIFVNWHSARASRAMRGSVIVFYGVWIICLLTGVQSLTQSPPITSSFIALGFVFFALYTLFDLIRSRPQRPIHKDERFLFSAAMLIMYAPHVGIYGAFPPELALILAAINSYLTIVTNVIYTAALYWSVNGVIDEEPILAPV